MATYNNTKKTYYSIGFGKIRRYAGEQREEFTGIDGVLTGISTRTHSIKGDEKQFVDFNFVDGDEKFCVSVEKYGSYCNTLVRALASVRDFSKKILIETYQKGDFTNMSIKQDGERLEWVDIPPVDEFQIPSGEVVKSTKNREKFIDGLIDSINHLAKNGGIKSPEPADGQHTGPAAGDDDMPAGDDPAAQTLYPGYVPNAGA